MKVQSRNLRQHNIKPGTHTTKVNLHKLTELGLYQIPEREPNSVKVTKKLLQYLEQQQLTDRHTIRIDYTQMNITEPTYCSWWMSLSNFIGRCTRPLITAGCLILVIGLSVLFVGPTLEVNNMNIKADAITKPITVTYMSDLHMQAYKVLNPIPVAAESIPEEVKEEPIEHSNPIEDMIQDDVEDEQVQKEISEAKEESSTLVMANVKSSLNVRTEPSKDAAIVGILYQNTGGTIMEQEDGWTKIASGDLVGWAKDDYLLFDDEAKKLADEVGTLTATVTAPSLNVRDDANSEASVLGSVKENMVLNVTDDTNEEWVQIDYDNTVAYVSTDFVDVSFTIPTGDTIEAIEERKAIKAAKQAENMVSTITQVSGNGIAASPTELNMLAAIIYCEAGNQPYEGKVAVGGVVVNRILSESFPNNVESVIRASGQFSPVASGIFDSVYGAGSWSDSCYQAAIDATNGAKGGVGNALYFRNPKKSSAHAGITIGDHVFW